MPSPEGLMLFLLHLNVFFLLSKIKKMSWGSTCLLKSQGGARWAAMVEARWAISLPSHYGFNEWVIPKMFKFNFQLLVHC